MFSRHLFFTLTVTLILADTCSCHEGSHDHSEMLGFDSDLLERIEDVLKRKRVDNILKKRDFVRNTQHIKEHMEGAGKTGDLDNASDEELEFNFFKLHDTDNDRHLDGLELLASMSHAMQFQVTKFLQRGLPQDNLKEKVQLTLNYLTKQVDKILEEDDLNQDGYLSYTEFASARRAINMMRRPEGLSERNQ